MPGRQSYVYFMRPVGAVGPVKIGCSTGPIARLAHYQAWSPVPLEVVAVLQGSFALEWAFHAKFAHLHLHHEWFAEDPELIATMEAICAGAFDTTTLPEPKRLQSPAQIAAWRRPKPLEAA
jgi:hypothetical protein